MVKPRTRFVATAILATALCPAGAGSIGDIPDEARQTMVDMRITAAVLMAHATESTGVPVAKEKPIPLDTLVDGIESIYRKRLVLWDAWGNRLLFFGEPRSFALLSVGPDRVLDEPFEDLAARSRYQLFVSSLSGGDDIVLAEGEFIKRPMTEKERIFERQKITMADMRSIGTAIEEYAIDNNVYPDLTGGLAPLDALRSLVEPIYIRTLPMTDAWGRPFLVWSKVNGYMIIGTGSDGLLDSAYDRADEPSSAYGGGGAFTDPESDVIFVNGQFVQWPEGTQQ